MYNKKFWKNVEKDRVAGMTVEEVCRKYNVIPETLRRARYRGLLQDPKQLNAAEARQKREWLENLPPSEIVDAFNQNNCAVKRTLEYFKMTASANNINCLKNILAQNNVEIKKSAIGKHSYTKEQFSEACKNSTTLTELCYALGLTVHTSNNRKLKRLISEYQIDISHWGVGKKKRKYSYEEIFCRDSKIVRTRLRHTILQFGILDLTECSQCGTSEWQGQPLKIQVDHINGDSRDNRIENLRGLCPNCHSLTETYTGSKQNIKKK